MTKRSVPGIVPRTTEPRGVAFCRIGDCSISSMSLEEDTVSPLTVISRVLPAHLTSSWFTHVLSGKSRDASSTNAPAGGVACFFPMR